MNRKHFAIFVFCLFATAVFSQDVTLGIKMGYNSSLEFSENWESNSQSYSMKNALSNGFNVGLISRFGKRIFGQVEVVYNRNYTSFSIGENTENHKVILQSIDVPVLFGVKIIDKRNFNWRLMVGPNFSFDVKSETDCEETPLSYTLRKSLIGLDCGMGFDVWHFALDFRYRLMQNRFAYQYLSGNENKTINNKPMNNFEVSVAWKFLDKNRKK